MTTDELYDFLHIWITQIINTEGGRSILIIPSNDDYPPPAGTYITVDFAPNKNKLGRPQAATETDSAGNLNIYNDKQILIEVWEVNSTGDLLNELQNSIDRSDIIALFNANKLAYMRDNGIRFIPRLQEESWKREFMMEIILGLSEKLTYTPSYIGDVEYNGTIPAEGRSGNHTITNT